VVCGGGEARAMGDVTMIELGGCKRCYGTVVFEDEGDSVNERWTCLMCGAVYYTRYTMTPQQALIDVQQRRREPSMLYRLRKRYDSRD